MLKLKPPPKGNQMKYFILALALFLLVGCGGTNTPESNKTASEYPVANGWALTSDLTPSSGTVTTYILIDPHGQKFLIVRGSGIAIIPYKEPEASKVEK
jgi:hypothetical protein